MIESWRTDTKQSNEVGRIRRIYFLLKDKFTALEGEWYGAIKAEALFCSDIALTLPPGSEYGAAANCIIHPDDKDLLSNIVSEVNLFPDTTSYFRVIDSYGEIKEIQLRRITKIENLEINPIHEVLNNSREKELELLMLREENAALRIKEGLNIFAEKYNKIGTFFLNNSTGKIHYSDQVFIIHGLPPQSLNANLYIFFPFIHQEDQPIVRNFLDRSIIENVPLSFNYRITTPRGEEKIVQLTTTWTHTEKGESILFGIINDCTESERQEENINSKELETRFQKQLIAFDEQAHNIGHWQLNLLSRKFSFSENYSRLFGLKPQSIHLIDPFINLVHPDDRVQFMEAYEIMKKEHIASEIEFRIITPGGKLRFIKQKGKTLIHDKNEIIILGTIQDITRIKIFENRYKDALQELEIKKLITRQTEELSGIGSWVEEIETRKVTWSEQLYEFMGYKNSTVQPSHNLLLKFVHADDRKKVSEQISNPFNIGLNAQLEFRIITRGITKTVKASFKQFTYNDKLFFSGILQDTTDASLLQLQLTERASIAELITSTIQDRMLSTDINHTITEWNKRCEESFGWKGDEVIGKNFFDIFPYLRAERLPGLLEDALSGKKIHLSNSLHYHKKERYDIQLLPMFNSGKVIGVLHLLHDITNELVLQQTLSERLQFIEKLLDASVDKIMVVDRFMNFLYWNLQCEKEYNLPKDQVVGKNVLELLPFTKHDPSYLDFKEALSGHTVHIPMRVDINGRGEEFYLIPIKGELDQVKAVLWISHDMTKEYEARLQRERADNILNSINDAYVAINQELNITYVNHKTEELWNMAKEDLIGKGISGLFPQFVGNDSYLAVIQALENNVTVKVEFISPILKRWLQITVIPSNDHAIALFSDTHEIREFREKLVKENKGLKEAQAIGHVGSFERDIINNRIYWSDEMYRIHGLAPQIEEMTLDKWYRFVHPEDIDLVKSKIMELGKVAQVTEFKYRILKEGVGVRNIFCKVESFKNANGVITHTNGTIQDLQSGMLQEQQI